MKLIFNRRVFVGGKHYLRGEQYDIHDDAFVRSLILSKRASLVDPAEPMEVPDEVPAVEPDADVPVGEAADGESLACPFGCRDGKPYSARSWLDQHLAAKHP